MADLSQPPSVNQTESAVKKPESVNRTNQPGTNPPSAPSQQQQSQTPSILNPNPNLIPSFAPPSQPPGVAAAIPPSFRPVPQFSPVPNFQNPSMGVQPPGVTATTPVMASRAPGVAAAPAVGTTGPIQPLQMMPYQVIPPPPPGQVPMRPFAAPLAPNGFVPPGVAGIQRFPSPYPMVRPMFPRPPGAPSMLPVASRPLIPGVTGARPIISPIIRPPVPSVAPAEKPQTIVYVGKISPSVDNEFMLSLLRLCGPVKSWKRVQDPSDGTLRRFGFCEFESAEGVLRALRLLSKFQIDGQELMLNVDQATKEFLQHYVEKKTENAKNLKENQAVGMDKEDDAAPVVENKEPQKSSGEVTNNDGSKGIKEDSDPAKFGIVTELDIEGDKEAMEKLTSMIEERLKTHPLPPPPPPPPTSAHGSSANSESAAKSRDGDSDPDTRHAEDKNNDDLISDNTPATELDRAETSSPDRSRKHDRRSRERDREREKEREIERYEREAERERIRKERGQRRKIEEAEREYEERLKDWEYREREKEKQRQYEKEKDKERDRKRRKEILYEEEGDEDDSRKRWRRSALDDRRRKRQREKEEDLSDRVKEEEEIAEAKKKAEEEKMRQQQRDASKLPSDEVMNETETKPRVKEVKVEVKDDAAEQDQEGDSGNGGLQNGNADETTMTSTAQSDIRQSGNIPAKKLGFGLVGSGKRTAVPSVFHEEDDDDARKDKKMRPLVPIDYTTEELQAVQPNGSGAQPQNLAAAAEFAKRISNSSVKEEKPDVDRERSRRSHDRSGQRDRDRHDEDASRTKDEKDKTLEWDKSREHDKVKTPDKQKILDAKQLIDMIPKTKDELFSFEINWAVYDKHGLHERMRPWISKKIVEFLGEEETTLVDYIVSSTQEHVKATQMLEMLQSILDDEAEMFVLKMWRMLIFEIKKVESGLAVKSRS